jgi:hypothetical protein
VRKALNPESPQITPVVWVSAAEWLFGLKLFLRCIVSGGAVPCPWGTGYLESISFRIFPPLELSVYFRTCTLAFPVCVYFPVAL